MYDLISLLNFFNSYKFVYTKTINSSISSNSYGISNPEILISSTHDEEPLSSIESLSQPLKLALLIFLRAPISLILKSFLLLNQLYLILNLPLQPILNLFLLLLQLATHLLLRLLTSKSPLIKLLILSSRKSSIIFLKTLFSFSLLFYLLYFNL